MPDARIMEENGQMPSEEHTTKPRRPRWGLRIGLLLILLLFGGLVWFGRMTYRVDRACGDGHALYLALRYYAEDHGGNLPSAFDDLVEGQFLREVPKGAWRVREHPTVMPHSETDREWSLAHPDWFDVAWGINVSEIDDRGWVARLGRSVVRPSADAVGFAELGSGMCSVQLRDKRNQRPP